jgi:hypothetical protein
MRRSTYHFVAHLLTEFCLLCLGLLPQLVLTLKHPEHQRAIPHGHAMRL